MLYRNLGVIAGLIALFAVAVPAFGNDRTDDESASSDLSIAQALSASFSRVAEKAVPAVVYVSVESKAVETPLPLDRFMMEDPFDFFRDSPFERFFEKLPHQPTPQPSPHRFRRGQGSGFLVSSDGLIMTNNHVVDDAEHIHVRLHDGRKLEAELVGADPESDVALIRIEGEKLPHLPLGDSSRLRVGELVVAVGNPFGLSETVTSGIVSAKGRTHVGLANYENFIQTDAAINPGNSGGPLLNLHGEVVGINAAIYSRSGGNMGIGFAIPINFAKAIRKQLEDGGSVVRGFLGVTVQDLTPELASSFGSDEARGAVIADVNEGSPAGKAGVLPGDIVIGLDDMLIRDSGMLRNEIALRKPGSNVELEIIRNGGRRTLTVSLGTRPALSGAGDAAIATPATDLGISVEPMTRTAAKQLGVDITRGVLIRRVTPASPAALVGLEAGQVILEVDRQPVNDPAAFHKAVAADRTLKQVLLRVLDQRGSRYIVVPMR